MTFRTMMKKLTLSLALGMMPFGAILAAPAVVYAVGPPTTVTNNTSDGSTVYCKINGWVKALNNGQLINYPQGVTVVGFQNPYGWQTCVLAPGTQATFDLAPDGSLQLYY